MTDAEQQAPASELLSSAGRTVGRSRLDQATPAAVDRQKAGGDGEGDAGAPIGFLGPALCLGLFLGTGVGIIFYGPTRLLREILNLIPAEPGWEWYVGMWFFTMLSIILLMPIWPPMCMASGLIFGVLDGTIINFFAIWGAAVISAAIGRWLLRAPIRGFIHAGDYPFVRRLMLVLEDSESTLKFQILFRFLFIPMFLRNYGPSTLQIPFWTLVVGSIPHSLWISLLFASLGSTFKDTAALIRDGKELDLSTLRWQQGLIFAVSMLLAVFLAVFAHQKYREKLDEEEAGALRGKPRAPVAYVAVPRLQSEQ